MINVKVEFYSGNKDKLFRVIRTPAGVVGRIIYVQPFFEQANTNRHVFTRSAINLYKHGFESIIYDHFATGDSFGRSENAHFTDWRADLLKQIQALKEISESPIILIAFESGALLLNDEILNLVDTVQLWQAQLNGKQLVKQLKRIALLEGEKKQSSNENIVEIFGYLMSKKLLDDISTTVFVASEHNQAKLYAYELVCAPMLFLSEKRQQQLDETILNTRVKIIEDDKYWQASELVIPEKLLLDTAEDLVEIYVHD